MQLDLYLTPLRKMNLNWIKDSNIRHETVKLLEGNIGKELLDIYLGSSNFLNVTPKAEATKAKISETTSN